MKKQISFIIFSLLCTVSGFAQDAIDNDSIAFGAELPEFVITSDHKSLIKTELDKITYNVAEDNEAKTANVLDILKKVPLITVDGSNNIEFKGSSNFKIYVNAPAFTYSTASLTDPSPVSMIT